MLPVTVSEEPMLIDERETCMTDADIQTDTFIDNV